MVRLTKLHGLKRVRGLPWKEHSVEVDGSGENIEVVSDGFNFVSEKVQETFWKIDQRKYCWNGGDGFFLSEQVVSRTEQLFT